MVTESGGAYLRNFLSPSGGTLHRSLGRLGLLLRVAAKMEQPRFLS